VKQSKRSLFGTVKAAARVAVRRPDLIRNRAYGMFNYWPVSRLKNERIRKIPHFCISLTYATKRRELTLRQAKQLGLEDFRFVDAVVGAELDLKKMEYEGLYDDARARKYHGRSLTTSEVALSLTHLQIFKTIVDEGLEEAIILEDDVLFMPRNLNALNFSDVPQDCDILFIHAHTNEDTPEGHVRGNIYTDESYQASSVAYLVNQKSARKLIKASLPVIHSSDGLLGRLMRWKEDQPHAFRQQGVDMELTCYIVHPPGALNGSACHFMKSMIDN